MDQTRRTVATEKLRELKSGKVVITNGPQLDDMLKLGDDAIYQVRSLPNPKRCGILDQYIAWIGDSMTPPNQPSEKQSQGHNI